LLADKATIHRASHQKKFGGGMRQWVIWLQPEFMLNNNIERLTEDHRRAKELGRC
jgi:threonine aldolase